MDRNCDVITIVSQYLFFKKICNPGQNIWHKIEKSSKTERGKKSLISTYTYLLTAIAKV